MISGRPPFHGENHIDLLRNIQRKAVRLPPEVRVSKECVNLLRLLLNRNPLSRAGFKEFFQAAEAFVALGCQGEGTPAMQNVPSQQTTRMDMGTIQEVDATGASSMLTVDTTAVTPQHPQPDSVEPTPTAGTQRSLPATDFVTPPFGPTATPPTLVTVHPLDQGNHPHQYHNETITTTSKPYQGFVPLEPSPPHSGPEYAQAIGKAPTVPVLKSTDHYRRTDCSQNSSGEESEFVIVEHNTRSGSLSPLTSVVKSNTPSNSSSPRYYVNTTPGASSCSARGEYLVVNGSPRAPKGILSTSPGTGATFMLGAKPNRAQSISDNATNSPAKLETRIEAAKKMLTTSEDVGRRAVSVAHLGDTRAYLAMRLIMSNGEGSSLLSSTPMEGVEEAYDEHSSAAVTDCEDASCSTFTEVIVPTRRRSSSMTDRSMPDAKPNTIEEVDDEMPFALESNSMPKSVSAIPVRSSGSKPHRRGTFPRAVAKPSARTIQSHFGEALSCYLKALSMLKGSVSGAQRVLKDLNSFTSCPVTSGQRSCINAMSKRGEVASSWLSGQFTGVLERADAATTEIGKLPVLQTVSDRNENLPAVSVEELVYNHSLACGRDGAVKQLLGQSEAARSCYRSAGLLAETLLMEPKIGNEDKHLLEGYVDDFAARITELDGTMLQQSRLVGNSPSNSLEGSKRKGQGSVIGLIGGIVPTPVLSSAGCDDVGPFHRSDSKPTFPLAI